MKLMKKMLALFLALLMVLSLTACGSKEPVAEPEPDIDGPGGLSDVSDEPVEEPEKEEEISPYPGKLPLGGETASGQVIEIPEEGSLEYLGSKIVSDDYGDSLLLSWFMFNKTGDYENSVSWCMTIYAYQNEESLWSSSYTYNDVVLDDTLYEEIEPGDSLEVCMAYELESLTAPVTITFSDVFEELEPIELTVDLAEVEKCLVVSEEASGFFAVNYLQEGDKVAYYEDLVASGLAANTYVELFGDGTGLFCFNGYEYDILYDEDCIYIEDDVHNYTIVDDYLTMESENLYYEYIRAEKTDDVPAEEEEDFVGETVTTEKGYVSITLQKGWYVGEPRSNYALSLYNDEYGPSKWVEILDLQLTDLEHELEYTHLALASAEYEEVTFGENTYQMLYSDDYSPQTYLVAETSTGKAFTVEVRNLEQEVVMEMLESIVIH